jgi:small subunit ribosomal protein S6
MQRYEVTFILSAQTTQEQAQKKSEALSGLVQQNGGTVTQHSNLLAKPLAYPIKKQSSGFFGTIEFQAEPEAVKMIEETLEKDVEVIRHLLLVKKTMKPKKIRERKKKETAEESKETVSAAPEKESKATAKEEVKPAVELKDIEKELDQILGE